MMSDRRIINVGVISDGIKYNSYLVGKNHDVLIDTVPKKLSGELIENINKITSINNLKYVILNHTEEDRSGAVFSILKNNPNITIISTIAGLKNIIEQLNFEPKTILAKSEMVFEIDDEDSVKFIITHNINWPDSMMTYYEKERALFSCDAFSCCDEDRFSYFKNNLSVLSEYVYNGVKKLCDIDIKTIYPGSGDVIQNPKVAIDEYLSWSETKVGDLPKITLIYESYTNNTKELADYSKDFFKNKSDILFEVVDINSKPLEEIAQLVYLSDGVIFGCPTFNKNIPKKISELVFLLNHYKMSKVTFCSYGSYGWSGEAPDLLYSVLRARHFKTYKSPFRYMFRANEDNLLEFNKFLSSFYEKIINI